MMLGLLARLVVSTLIVSASTMLLMKITRKPLRDPLILAFCLVLGASLGLRYSDREMHRHYEKIHAQRETEIERQKEQLQQLMQADE